MARRPSLDPASATFDGARTEPRRIDFPRPDDGDLEDVQVALAAGRALWEGGDEAEALRWLRRAAGIAAERDADPRALVLVKVAAEIASELEARKRASGSATTSTAPVTSGGPPPLPEGPDRGRSLVPPLPRAAAVLEVPRARAAKGVDESDEKTFIRPETMLRRALLAIDPWYAERTDYAREDEVEDERDAAPPASRPRTSSRSSQDDSWTSARRALDSTTAVGPASDDALPSRDSDTMALVEADTERRASAPSPSSTIPGALPAVRVAVLPIPEERDVRLVFLGPDAEPPRGVVVATLVPVSEEDARRLATIFANTAAKL